MPRFAPFGEKPANGKSPSSASSPRNRVIPLSADFVRTEPADQGPDDG